MCFSCNSISTYIPGCDVLHNDTAFKDVWDASVVCMEQRRSRCFRSYGSISTISLMIWCGMVCFFFNFCGFMVFVAALNVKVCTVNCTVWMYNVGTTGW